MSDGTNVAGVPVLNTHGLTDPFPTRHCASTRPDDSDTGNNRAARGMPLSFVSHVTLPESGSIRTTHAASAEQPNQRSGKSA